MIALALASLFTLSAHAEVIDITPKNPINCQQPQLRKVSWVKVATAQDGDNVSLDLDVTFGTCQNGGATLLPISANYNFYLIDREYSPDVSSDYALSSPTSVHARMTLRPSQFFSVTNVRHFDLDFYPDAGSISYGWNVVISKDAVTGNVIFAILPR